MIKKKKLKSCAFFEKGKYLRIANILFLILVIGVLQASAVNYAPNIKFKHNIGNKVQNKISGKVIDGTGFGIPGVNITIKGSSEGTITDIDGNFSIEIADENTVLVFSFVGMKTQEIIVGNQTTINVTMIEDATGLDEIVVVGYGVMKKKLKTGASINVKGEDLLSRNASNVMNALQGISPGVSITQNNGQPGSGTKVYIRGMGTIGDSDPLYIVNGVAVDDIDYLSPSDIESVDVLKDAASAAIYGSRAANGVILVTTKKGTKGKMQISYDGYIGWQNVYKDPELLDAKKYAELMNEMRFNKSPKLAPYDFSDVPDWDKIESGEWAGTNWFEEIKVPNAPIQNHAISISGGSEKAIYSLGISYLDQQGILGKQANSEYKRLNLRINSEYILWQKNERDILKFGENLTFTNKKNPSLRTGDIYWSDVHNTLEANPFLPVYDENGDYHYVIDWDEEDTNPIGIMDYQSKNSYNTNNYIVGNVYIELQPIKNLKIRSVYGANMSFGSSRKWIPAYDLSSRDAAPLDEVEQTMDMDYSWTLTNTISYDFDIAEDHNFTVMVGQEAQKTMKDWNMKAGNKGSLFNDAEHAYINNVPITDLTIINLEGKDNYGWSLFSYFGRLSYNYKEKYMLTAVMRADGSSNFAKDNQWGYFPSVSAGWVVTNENFMSSTSNWLNFLKIRGSWGQNGNEAIPPYQYLATITYDEASYFFGTEKEKVDGANPKLLPNPDISWETSEQTDIGIDAHFLNSRLQLTFDWYKKDTRDWLVQAPILANYGVSEATYINGGAVQNKGFEIMARWNDNIGEFKYGISASLAKNKNEVVSIENEEKIIHGKQDFLRHGTSEFFLAEEGFPIGYFWGYETDGILQNEDEVNAYVSPDGEKYFSNQAAGDVRFVDQDQDGKINDDDKVMIGDPNPDFVFGFQVNAEFKGFYINVMASGMIGHQIIKNYRTRDKANYTQFDYDNRWTGEGTSNKYPRLIGSHRNTKYISDIFVEDGDFLRISNLTIGYSFKKLFANIPVSDLRIYVSAKNLYTFTKYSGMDPEVGYGPTSDTDPSNNYPWASGIDLGLYPASRTFLVGVNVDF